MMSLPTGRSHTKGKPLSIYPAPKNPGVVLVLVVLVLCLLAIFIFSYNYLARRQYDRLHFEEISEVTSLLSYNGARFLARNLENLPENFRRDLFAQIPDLFRYSNQNLIEVATGTPDLTGNLLSRIAWDFQNLLNNHEFSYRDRLSRFSGGVETHPKCEGMGITFRKVRMIQPFQFADPKSINQTLVHEILNSPLQFSDRAEFLSRSLASGRDGVEKWGEAYLSCSVYFRGVSRVITLRKQFRLVSMIPGPYSRFSLFAPYTPHEESYNAVTNSFSGNYVKTAPKDDCPRRLVLINSNETFDTSVLPKNLPSPLSDPNQLLQKSGWVFLGPPGTPSDPTREGVVTLRVPSGFDPAGSAPSANPFSGYLSKIQTGIGGQIYLTWPKKGREDSNQLVSTPREVVGPAFKVDKTRTPEDMIVSQLTGLYSGGKGPNMHQMNLWYKPDASAPGKMAPIEADDCLTSWLLPYGTRQYISRTLMVGNVLAIFAEYFQLWWDSHCTPPEANFGFIKPFLPVATLSFSLALDPEPWLLWIGKNPVLPTSFGDFLNAGPPDDPTGEGALGAISPKFGQFPHQNFSGIPFNLIFDLMDFGIDLPDLDTWMSLPNNKGIGKLDNRRAVPGIFGKRLEDGVLPPDSGPWRMIQPSFIQLWKDDAGANPQFGKLTKQTYYYGNLLECDFRKNATQSGEFVKWGIFPRVTEIIDFSSVSPGNEVRHLFNLRVLSLSPGYPGKYVFSRPGVYLLMGLSGEELVFDKPIALEAPGIFILHTGTISLPGVECKDLNSDGTAQHLFSIIALDGNIKLADAFHGGAIPNHCFLAALNSSISKTGLPASILNSQGLKYEPSSQIFISGGVAASVVSDPRESASGPPDYPTMFSDFYGGGIIRYNPAFNPSLPANSSRYQLIFDRADFGIDAHGG